MSWSRRWTYVMGEGAIRLTYPDNPLNLAGSSMEVVGLSAGDSREQRHINVCDPGRRGLAERQARQSGDDSAQHDP